ncbi:MAG TPA: M23 family metallopeptidase [Candidimonas sp.]|nr:M23 family metallopeptidase [Candidimonas sp.]
MLLLTLPTWSRRFEHSFSFTSCARLLATLSLLALLAACSTTKPVGENEYRVARGDTLTQVARKHGQSVSSLKRLNNLNDVDNIRVGQVLKIKGSPVAVAKPTPSPKAKSPSTKSSSKSPTAKSPAAKSTSVAAPRSINLIWPAQGKSRRGTSASDSQAVYIAAAAGSPIKAAAAGKVAYSGNGLRGYGNMLIVYHDASFLSIYAHNKSLLVKEGAQVKQGQTIATMGNTGGSKAVNLYFELRYNGKAVDALRYLPKTSSR